MKLGMRVGLTALVALVSGATAKLATVMAHQEMASVAVDQLSNSNAAETKFQMLYWFMNSGWSGLAATAIVVGLLYVIWKGQFKNA